MIAIPSVRRTRLFLIQTFLLSFAIARSEETVVYDRACLDSLPTPVSRNDQPKFPTESEGKRALFSVEVDYIVGTDGQTHNVSIVGDAHDKYDTVALRAVEKWHFKPGTRHGLAVATRMRQELFIPNEDAQRRRTRITNVRPKKDDTSSLTPFILGDQTVFPFSALQAGETGHVEVQYMVGYGGRARQLTVKEASSPEFALAAMAALECVYFVAAETSGNLLFETRTSTFDFRPDGSGNVTIRESAKRILRILAEQPELIVSTNGLDTPLKLIRSVSPTRPNAFYGGKPPIGSLEISQETVLASMSPRPPDGKSGEAKIEFYIDEDGCAQLPKVVSATEPEFGAAAAQAVSEWRFAPPTKEGKPVVVKVQVPVAFPKDDPKGAKAKSVSPKK